MAPNLSISFRTLPNCLTPPFVSWVLASTDPRVQRSFYQNKTSSPWWWVGRIPEVGTGAVCAGRDEFLAVCWLRLQQKWFSGQVWQGKNVKFLIFDKALREMKIIGSVQDYWEVFTGCSPELNPLALLLGCCCRSTWWWWWWWRRKRRRAVRGVRAVSGGCCRARPESISGNDRGNPLSPIFPIWLHNDKAPRWRQDVDARQKPDSDPAATTP